jgi:hypothetical protein
MEKSRRAKEVVGLLLVPYILFVQLPSKRKSVRQGLGDRTSTRKLNASQCNI